MPTIHLWRWRLTSEITGRRYSSRWVMSEADALALDPTAERLPHSLEVREVPEGGLRAHGTSDFTSQSTVWQQPENGKP